nr:hypothetical protein CFP56_62139 [Quercus suber]
MDKAGVHRGLGMSDCFDVRDAAGALPSTVYHTTRITECEARPTGSNPRCNLLNMGAASQRGQLRITNCLEANRLGMMTVASTCSRSSVERRRIMIQYRNLEIN